MGPIDVGQSVALGVVAVASDGGSAAGDDADCLLAGWMNGWDG